MSVVTQNVGVGSLGYPFYSGYSTDVKPLVTGDDATFYELDTRRTFIWKDRAWRLFQEPAMPVDNTVQLGILAELQAIREVLEALVEFERE